MTQRHDVLFVQNGTADGAIDYLADGLVGLQWIPAAVNGTAGALETADVGNASERNVTAANASSTAVVCASHCLSLCCTRLRRCLSRTAVIQQKSSKGVTSAD